MGDFIKQKFGEVFGAWLSDLGQGAIDGLTGIMPELTVLVMLGCVTVGMFTKPGRWAVRAFLVFAGGAAWLILI